MATFETAWRAVLLQAPDVPVFLARNWVQQAFARLSEDRPWVWQRKAVNLSTLASRSLTVGVTAASTAITSSAGFVASDAGRQFRVSSLPIYTILSVTSASAAVLDLPYTGSTDAAATGTILSAYVTVPSDFGAWLSIMDSVASRPLPFDLSAEARDQSDPLRLSSGDVRGLNAARPAASGLLQYEWWPYPSAARTYAALYRTRPATLADSDVLPGVLGQRMDLLITGALMECAKWPGTGSHPNAYFNLSTYQLLKKEFEEERRKLALRDDDQFAQDWGTAPSPTSGPWGDTHYLRASDATLADYY